MAKSKDVKVNAGTLEVTASCIRGAVSAIEKGEEERFAASFGTDPLTALMNIANTLDHLSTPKTDRSIGK